MSEIRVKVTKYADRRYFIMYYIDPITERMVSRSTKKTLRREAEREAAKWEVELQEGGLHADARITWDEFRQRYELQSLAEKRPKTREIANTALGHFERIVGLRRLASVNKGTVADFRRKAREEGMKGTTLDAYLRHLKAAFNWAKEESLLVRTPTIKTKRAKGKKPTLMKGRPITGEEFERMLEKVPKVRPRDAGTWQHYLRGLWLSGLRLEESLVASWDEDAPFAVDMGGRHPRFKILACAQKAGRDELLPITPDFAEFLLATPEEAREGRLFKITGIWTGEPITPKRVSRIVSAIGKAAGVLVNKAEGKYASAHDLRRSFGTRWAPRVNAVTLKQLMRHASIETTLRYYVDLDADEVGDQLRAALGPINSFINSGPVAPPDSEEGSIRGKA